MTRPDFETLVAEHRGELFAHCYRMLGSPQDAEDVLQEALVGAWRGYAGFEGRSRVRTWLYTIATNACLQHLRKERRRRVTTPDLGPAYTQTADLGEPRTDVRFVEPLATDPEASYLEREALELAFVAALQHLPANQRAVLVLREVLQLSAAEVGEVLGTTPASVNSALQRARATVRARVPREPQQVAGAASEAEVRRLVEAFMSAWERADLDRLTALLADDVRFTMPPLPAWFDGLAMVRRFLAERVFATPWRLEPISVNGQVGFRCHQEVGGVLAPAAVNALTLRSGRVTRISAFVDPAVVARFRTAG